LEEERVLSAILAVIADDGPASLESLIDTLQPSLRPGEVARAFQAARADQLIEAVAGRGDPGDPVYLLTDAGREAAQGSAVPSIQRHVTPISRLSTEAVLRVVDEFGEASLGLVSWELCLSDDQVLATWQLTFAEGLVEEAGYDEVHKEQMARLTELGRQRLTVVDEMTG
jgi:DNA-binding PadR family transcriptional regulator